MGSWGMTGYWTSTWTSKVSLSQGWSWMVGAWAGILSRHDWDSQFWCLRNLQMCTFWWMKQAWGEAGRGCPPKNPYPGEMEGRKSTSCQQWWCLWVWLVFMGVLGIALLSVLISAARSVCTVSVCPCLCILREDLPLVLKSTRFGFL